jgi:hypothetical protein
VEVEGHFEEMADRLMNAIVVKLEVNKAVIARSRFGRLTWRRQSNGEIEIDLEPKL